MYGLVKYGNDADQVKLMEIPIPISPPAGFVKIKIKAAGICGTDIHLLHGMVEPIRAVPPVVLGHEFSGEITEVGQGVTKVKIGQRVTSETQSYICNNCIYCKDGFYNLCSNRKNIGVKLDGAFTEYILIPEQNVHVLPDNISYEEGALIEPLACVVHGIIENTKISAGDFVVVSGPGPIGLLALQVAKAEGAFVIVLGTSSSAKRLSLAKELGADVVLDIYKDDYKEEIFKITNGYGADVVLECAGKAQSANQCLEIAAKRGKYCQLGLFWSEVSINFDLIAFKELKVTGEIAHKPSAWERSIRLIKNNQVDLKPLVTHRLPLSKWEEGFKLFQSREACKVVLVP